MVPAVCRVWGRAALRCNPARASGRSAQKSGGGILPGGEGIERAALVVCVLAGDAGGNPLPGAGVPSFQPIPGGLRALGCGVLCFVALADTVPSVIMLLCSFRFNLPRSRSRGSKVHQSLCHLRNCPGAVGINYQLHPVINSQIGFGIHQKIPVVAVQRVGAPDFNRAVIGGGHALHNGRGDVAAQGPTV